MDDMESKLGASMNDPDMMQKIMSMAQALSAEAPSGKANPAADPPLPGLDLGMVQKLSSLASQGSIDKREQALLRALGAYLSKDRIGRLEKAMRAAKMAKLASSGLSRGGLLSSIGR